MKKIVLILVGFAIVFCSYSKTYSISEKGIKHIKKYENCSLTAYKDAGGYSIGWGHHTSDVKAGQKISQKQADQYLKEDLKEAEKYANLLISKLTYKYEFSQGFFDGLVSLVYNCGYGGIKNSKFYSLLNKCRVKDGKMNESDYVYTISFVKSTNISNPGHKERRIAEMNMMK